MMAEFDELSPLSTDDLGTLETLTSWVIHKRDEWRDFYEDNDQPKHQEYYRIWRGISSDEDNTTGSRGKSARSRIITPGAMQAAEENAAEIEEATFTGKLFDIRDDHADKASGEFADIQLLREKLTYDLQRAKVKPAIAECILNAAVYGTGAAEVEMSEVIEQKPAVRDIEGIEAKEVGVETRKRTQVRLRPILPQNLLVDPNACTVDDGLGVIIDEYVGSEKIKADQEAGIYDDSVDVGTIAVSDFDLEPVQDFTIYNDDRVRRCKYIGMVPRHLLEAEQDHDIVDLNVDSHSEEDSYFVEAIVVLGNDKLLMAIANPYMMQDRPVVAFPWDVVPGRFHGRGVIEKAYNVQKATDIEVRSRIDALALTIHPMLAVDATRMPRGSTPTVAPGKMLKTNGNPAEILQPFKFGDVSQINFAQAQELQKMLQQATGAVNSAGMPAAAAGGAAGTGAMAMALGSVMKRHKRTLLAFQDCFLLPFIEKAAWRYMQFDAENYPVGDYNFHCEGSLGLIGREYEVSQLTFLLQTMGADSPLYPVVLRSIVDNMSLTNREALLSQLDEASKPDEQEQQMAQEKHAIEMEVQKTTLGALAAQAAYDNTRAANQEAEMKNIPIENEIAFAKIAVNDNSPENSAEVQAEARSFENKLRILSEIREDRKLVLAENESAANIANKRDEVSMKRDEAAAMKAMMSDTSEDAPINDNPAL